MRSLRFVLFFVMFFSLGPVVAFAHDATGEICTRPAAGSSVAEPPDLRSKNGVLSVELAYHNFRGGDGRMRYCYVSRDGSEAPTLRLNPGDLLILRLKNDLQVQQHPADKSPMDMAAMPTPMPTPMPIPMIVPDACASAQMTAASTNLHFHGLSVPPLCHEDDVLKTMIQPGDPPFEYRFRIPRDEPPGLYWYHPHVHGYTNPQVLGGASGALIIEGIGRVNREVAGLPERVLIVRDQELLNPDAQPSKSDAAAQLPVLRDAEGDILNTGADGGKPAKDLSLNFVPVPYPDYPPAIVRTRPSERQLWRVLNASAITYIDLEVLLGGAVQPLGVVALDGVPINESGIAGNSITWQGHVALPPGGRAEFIFKGLPAGARASLITHVVDTGPAGENDPTRSLATIVSETSAPEPRSALLDSANQLAPSTFPWLGKVNPVRQRKLYFTERPRDPNDPKSPTVFMITLDGQKPAPYDPHASAPNIIVQQGDVEDWIIENRTQELHAFHIHQIHFVLMDWNGVPINEPYLRDTVNVPYWDGQSPVYPSIKVRMDFRDPNTVGTFVYHCHLLEHEDGGMMGTIRVDRSSKSARH